MISITTLLNVLRAGADILFVWVIIYALISSVKNNARSMQLFKGVLIIMVVKLLTTLFNLTTMNYIVDLVINYGVLGLIIIFHPEIRTFLEKIGRTSLRSEVLSENEKDMLLTEIEETVEELSKNKIGALITFEGKHALSEYITSGKYIDAAVRKELLLTIFYEGTPLHDGAVIIRGNKVLSAACFYPSSTQSLPTQYGARHRAAIGISEITDCLTIVVSEETGHISLASNGVLKQIDLSELRTSLSKEIDYFKGGN